MARLRADLRSHDLRLRRPPGRRVDVPAPQGAVEPERRPARRARGDRVDRRRARHRAPVLARGPLEPRQEHVRDGDRLELRDDRMRIRRQLCPTVRGAKRRRPRRSRIRLGGCRAAREPVPGADAQHRSRRLPGSGAIRLRPRCRAWRRHFAALGLAGRIRSGRDPRVDPRGGARPRRARLQDGRAAFSRFHGRAATRLGAQPSLPTAEELTAILAG